jgi:4-hydroxybenzoate polyprenyltransferase
MNIESIKAFFKLVRWFHELLAIIPFLGLYFVVNYFLAASHSPFTLSGCDLFLICICVQLLVAAGCIMNDIMDREIDKINKPKTHIVGRSISLTGAKKLFILFTVLIVLLSAYIACFIFREWAIISALVYVLSILYNVYFKKSPLLGNILIAFLASFVPLVILFLARNEIHFLNNEKINMLVYLYAGFSFLIIVPRELSLDISDMEGDKACGCRTLPIIIGARRSKLVVIQLIFVNVVLSVWLSLSHSYLIPVLIPVDILLFVYVFLLWRCETRIEYIKAGRFLWFIMISGLTGFTVVTIF